MNLEEWADLDKTERDYAAARERNDWDDASYSGPALRVRLHTHARELLDAMHFWIFVTQEGARADLTEQIPSAQRCGYCGGYGRVLRPVEPFSSGWGPRHFILCPECGGTGRA